MSNIKECLKQAREYINKKQYKEALGACRDALYYDKENYTVYLFIGLAAQNLDPPNPAQSEKAYRKATELDPNNPLAWQGLCDLFVKSNDHMKAVEALTKVLSLLGPSHARTREYTVKLARAHHALRNYEAALEQWQRVLSMVKADETSTFAQILDTWTRIITVAEEQEEADILAQARRRAEAATKEKKAVPAKAGAAPRATAAAAGGQPAPREEAVEQLPKALVEEVRSEVVRRGETRVDELYRLAIDELCKLSLASPVVANWNASYLRRLVSRSTPQAVVVRECRAMMGRFGPVHPLPYELLLLLQSEEEEEERKEPAGRLFRVLHHAHPWHGLGLIGTAMHVKQLQHDEAVELLRQGLKEWHDCVDGWLALADRELASASYRAAIDAIDAGLAAISRRGLRGRLGHQWSRLMVHKARAFTGSGQRAAATAAYEAVLAAPSAPAPLRAAALQGLAELALEAGDHAAAHERFSQWAAACPGEPAAVGGYGWACFLAGELDRAVDRLSAALQLPAENRVAGLLHYRLARVLWERATAAAPSDAAALFAESHRHLLQAAKLAPDRAEPFTLLGMYYARVGHDLDKARRCYQKALSLNPLDREAGEALSDQYVASGQEELAAALYHTVVEAAPSPAYVGVKWAWLRLARHDQKRGRWAEAVAAYQRALRMAGPVERYAGSSSEEDHAAWQGLAECYRRLGKYSAAVKAFAVVLDDTARGPGRKRRQYTLYQLASLKLLLGQREDAVRYFERLLLDDAEGNVANDHLWRLPAQKGLGETLLRLAADYYGQGAVGRAAATARRAVEVLRATVADHKALVCGWKLLGDALALWAAVAPHDAVSCLQDAATAYQQAISLAEHAASAGDTAAIATLAALHHDAGVAYYRLAGCVRSDGSPASEWLQRAAGHQRVAIRQRPQEPRYWGALGVVLASSRQYGAAHHALLRGLGLDRRNAVLWTNLGVLYLQAGQWGLARQAFVTAQSLDPTKPACWAAAGLLYELLAESARRKALPRPAALWTRKAAEAYKLAIDAGVSPEALRGWAYASLATGDAAAAAFALEKYVLLAPHDSGALNLLGLAREMVGLAPAAERALQGAETLLASTTPEEAAAVRPAYYLPLGGPFGGATDRLPAPSTRLLWARLNRARVLLRLARYRDALHLLDSCGDDIFAVALRGLCLVRCGNPADAAAAFEKFGAAIKTGEWPISLKRDVLISLTKVHVKNNNMALAKRSSSQCVQEHPSDPLAWKQMCAVALLSQEYRVAGDALSRFAQTTAATGGPPPLEQFRLTACLCLLQGDAVGARRAFAKYLHTTPYDPAIWHEWGALLADSADGLMSAALSLAPFFVGATTFSASSASPQLWKVAGMAGLLVGKPAESYLQRSLHAHPQSSTTWYLLVVASFCRAVRRRRAEDYRATLSLIDAILPGMTHKELQIACHQMLSDCSLFLEDKERAAQHAEYALEIAKSSTLPHAYAEVAIAYRQWARVELVRGNLKQAIEYYKSSLQLVVPKASPGPKINSTAVWLTSILLQELAQVFELHGNTALAETCLLRCAEIYDQASSRRGTCIGLLLQARYAYLSGQYKRALVLVEKAQRLCKSESAGYAAAANLLHGIVLLKLGGKGASKAASYLQAVLHLAPGVKITSHFLSQALAASAPAAETHQ